MTGSAEQRRARVVVLAPIGRDGQVICAILTDAGFDCEVCHDVGVLAAQLDSASAAIVAEEALSTVPDISNLSTWLKRQQTWSDFPFVLLSMPGQEPDEKRRGLRDTLGNVTILERPLRPDTIVRAVSAAARARSRQFQAADLLEARERTEAQLRAGEERLRELNETLEARVSERTAELVEAQTALAQAQKMEAVGQLTGGIAHDFNNLLMVITGGLDMLARHQDPDRRQRVTDGMRQAADRGAALTRQLLAFSRRAALRPEPIVLDERIQAMGELLERSLRGNIDVEMSFADDLWPVTADPTQIELAIINLAVNARDAMPTGGRLTVRAQNAPGVVDGELVGDFVSLSVTDTGSGMEPDVAARVFEPFFTTKEVGKGSGLGLAQIYGFARQSGGTVTVDSAPDVGTTVTILLPRSDVAPNRMHDDASSDAPDDGRPCAETRVLLVEDDDSVALLASDMICELGYSITRASDGAAALKKLDDDAGIQLVLSDIMMPGGMSGTDLAREIARFRPELPIVLTTGYDAHSPETAIKGFPVLRKPYRLETLQRVLREAMAKARR